MNVLMEFKQGYLILAGDLNFSMDRKLDSTSGALNRENKQLKLVTKKIHNYQLVDVWRIQHPSAKDYTYHWAVHDTDSRLDYTVYSWSMEYCNI